MKPVVKWAGGKTQLLDKLKCLMPKEYNRYYEPFIGGVLYYWILVRNMQLLMIAMHNY